MNVYKFFRKHYILLPLIAFGLLVVFFTRNFLFAKGLISYGEFFSSSDYLFFLKDNLTAWSDYTTLGHSNIGFPTTYGQNPTFWIDPGGFKLVLIFILTMLQFVFGFFTSKIYLLGGIILPFIGMYALSLYWFQEFKKNKLLYYSMAMIAALLYAVNPIMGDRIAAGHAKYLYAFGFLPLLLLSVFKFIESEKPETSRFFLYLSILSSSLILWLMPHLFSFFFFFLFLIFFLFVIPDGKKLKRFFFISFATAIGTLLLDINLWLPALFYSETYPLALNPFYYLPYVFLTSAHTTLFHLATIQNPPDADIVSAETYTKIVSLKYLLPLFALTGLANREVRKTLFLIALAIAGLIFTLGISPPFEAIYTFLFEHVFLFKPFRDVSKFLLLYLFALSLLVPYVLIYIHRFNKRVMIMVAIFIVSVILFTNPTFTTGNFRNTVVSFSLPEKYLKLKNFLNRDKGTYRVAVYPNDGLISSSDWYPKGVNNGSAHFNVFNSLLPIDKGLAISNRTVSDQSSRYLDFIESNIDREWAVRYLGEQKVKYIIVDHSQPNSPKMLEQLKRNDGLVPIPGIDGFSIFRIRNFNDKELKSQKVVYYYGDVKGLERIPADVSLINLDLNPIEILGKNISDHVVLLDSMPTDILLNSLVAYKFPFFPEVRFPKNQSTDFYLPWDYLRDIARQGISFTNPEIVASAGISKFTKSISLTPGNYRIFVRTYNSQLSTNKIRIKINSWTTTRINFNKAENTFKWIDVGNVKIKDGNAVVTIENAESKFFLLDYFLIIPESEYIKQEKKLASLIQNKKMLQLDKEDISNLWPQVKKELTVLPQSYSPYWNICDEKTMVVNFYAIGANCSDNKQVNPVFQPNQLNSLSTYLTLLFYGIVFLKILFYFRKGEKV